MTPPGKRPSRNRRPDRGGRSKKKRGRPSQRKPSSRKKNADLLPRVPLSGSKSGDAGPRSHEGGSKSADDATRDEKASPERLRQLMTDCGLEVNDLQVNLFWQYYLRLRERNRDINLTRIHRFEDVVVKHFVDCGMVGLLTALPSPLMDIGSGGGFPGVPLKILHPDVEIVLAEGRRLRVEFLEEVRRSLRLPKLHIHGHQIHPGNTDPQMQSVVTRAVERIGKTLQRVEGHCPVGSRAIFMKGPSVDPEIEEVKDGAPGARWRLAEDHHYLLPSTDHKRRLVVYERIAP